MALGDEYLKRKRDGILARIVAALRFRISRMVREPLVTELEFIDLTVNHGQYSDKLRKLGLHFAADEIQKNAFHVGLCWMTLAEEHLQDAESSLSATRPRSTFSRSYYAAYNASKAVRYIVVGAVSLKGDDHHKASDLPNDFPSVDKWAEMIPKLYEHRLFSDYDNWLSTKSEHTLSPDEAFELAGSFLVAAKSYLHTKFGI